MSMLEVQHSIPNDGYLNATKVSLKSPLCKPIKALELQDAKEGKQPADKVLRRQSGNMTIQNPKKDGYYDFIVQLKFKVVFQTTQPKIDQGDPVTRYVTDKGVGITRR